jgi:ABC-type transporter Mla subunit MlaD
LKKKLEIQTIVVLLCVLTIAGAWIGIQISKDSLGLWTQSSEIHFTSNDLLGLGPRAELRCAGAVIGNVRTVTPSLGPDGQAQFHLVAGVKDDFAQWRFAPVGIVKAGVVQSALAPSSISLELSSAPDAIAAVKPKAGQPPTLVLQKEQPKNDMGAIMEQYVKLGNQIDATIRQFTEPQKGRTKSVMQELAEAVPSAAASLQNVEGVTTNLKLQVGEDGKIDEALTSLNISLGRLQGLTDELTKTVTNVNLKLDTSLKKVNGLLEETTLTMTDVRTKMEGFGGTFVGRMLVGKPDNAPAPSPTPRGTR